MGLTTDLISFWEMEEASGTRVDAVTGTGNDLSENGSVAQAAGQVGNAAAPAGGTFLSHVSNASLQTGDISFTCAAWAYLTSNAITHGVINKWTSAPNTDYALYYNSTDSLLHFATTVPTDSYIDLTATTFGLPPNQTWFYVIAWHDADADAIYIQVNNGVVDSLPTGGALQAAGTAPLNIGNFVDTYFLNGRIDQVGFWKRVLTSDERTQLYNGGAGMSYLAMQTSPAPKRSRFFGFIT